MLLKQTFAFSVNETEVINIYNQRAVNNPFRIKYTDVMFDLHTNALGVVNEPLQNSGMNTTRDIVLESHNLTHVCSLLYLCAY